MNERKLTDQEIKKALECCTSEVTLELNCSTCSMLGVKDCMTETKKNALDLINRQQADIERFNKENDELKNGFFQEHYKEIECQELLSVSEAWRKESLHNIDLEAEIERLNGELIEQRTRRKNAVDAYYEAKAKIWKWETECGILTREREMYKGGSVEAVKEFAERLKGEYKDFDETHHQIFYSSLCSAIDNLVKEMAGE